MSKDWMEERPLPEVHGEDPEAIQVPRGAGPGQDWYYCPPCDIGWQRGPSGSCVQQATGNVEDVPVLVCPFHSTRRS